MSNYNDVVDFSNLFSESKMVYKVPQEVNPVQNEIYLEKLLRNIRKYNISFKELIIGRYIKRPIIIDKYNFIIDGHHSWFLLMMQCPYDYPCTMIKLDCSIYDMVGSPFTEDSSDHLLIQDNYHDLGLNADIPEYVNTNILLALRELESIENPISRDFMPQLKPGTPQYQVIKSKLRY